MNCCLVSVKSDLAYRPKSGNFGSMLTHAKNQVPVLQNMNTMDKFEEFESRRFLLSSELLNAKTNRTLQIAADQNANPRKNFHASVFKKIHFFFPNYVSCQMWKRGSKWELQQFPEQLYYVTIQSTRRKVKRQCNAPLQNPWIKLIKHMGSIKLFNISQKL